MDFKGLRKTKLRLSQEEFAKLYDVSIEKVQMWDEDNDVSYKILEKIAQNTGMTLDEITGYEKPKPKAFDAKNTWEKADFTKKSIVDYIKDALDKMDLPEVQKKNYIDDLQAGVLQNLVKPSISIVGRSDTGKSTLINALIGMEKMPTAWTPTTSIAVYIKHINDRPDFIKGDTWVFADSVGEEQLWNVKKLYNEDYCKKWKVAEGSVDILRQFGTRQGGKSEQNVGSAVVFLDAPILLDCDIVDLPGFGTDKESDDTITFRAAQRTDILIYLSQANGFMRIEDITYLKENVRNLPVWEQKEENKLRPLSNLFVVASQAHTVGNGNINELTNILKKGYENFTKTLSEDYWLKREEVSGYSGYGKKFLPTRFFTYTTDIPSLCTNFNSELKKILEVLPEVIHNRTTTFIREYVKKRKLNLEAELKKYENLLNERENYVTLLQEIDDNELKRTKDNDEQKQHIRDFISDLSTQSRDEFINFCSETINTDALIKRIKSKGIKNKKEDVECFASQLQDELQAKCDSILGEKAKILSEKTEKYVKNYSEGIKAAFEKSSIEVDFDAGFAFASSLAAIGILGGLGAYIAGEAAFWFGSMAFIAGLGGDIALGASMFGPVGITIGIAIIATLGLVELFGGGWEKREAKKIVKEYDENGVVEKYCTAISDYWNKTENAFNQAAEELDMKWNEYVDNLRDTVNNYDVNKIQGDIQNVKNIMAFFDNIPL